MPVPAPSIPDLDPGQLRLELVRLPAGRGDRGRVAGVVPLPPGSWIRHVIDRRLIRDHQRLTQLISTRTCSHRQADASGSALVIPLDIADASTSGHR